MYLCRTQLRTAMQAPLSYSADPPLQRISRVIIARRARMSRRDQPVHQRRVLSSEAIGECARVVVPLLNGARAGNGAGDQPIVQHPGEGELPGRNSAHTGVLGESLGDSQVFGAIFGLQNALVLTLGTGASLRRRVETVFPGQNAARQRAVWEYAHPEVETGR